MITFSIGDQTSDYRKRTSLTKSMASSPPKDDKSVADGLDDSGKLRRGFKRCPGCEAVVFVAYKVRVGQ